MTFPITALYASALAILAIVLSIRVSLMRGTAKVALGDGGNPILTERIRQHSNLVENAPLALILLALAEAQGTSPLWLHLSGGILLASRLIHPLGIRHDQPANPVRIVGSVGTTTAMLIAVVALLRHAAGM